MGSNAEGSNYGIAADVGKVKLKYVVHSCHVPRKMHDVLIIMYEGTVSTVDKLNR